MRFWRSKLDDPCFSANPIVNFSKRNSTLPQSHKHTQFKFIWGIVNIVYKRNWTLKLNNSIFKKYLKCTNRKVNAKNQPYQFSVVHNKKESNPSDYLSKYTKIHVTTEDQKIEQYVNFIITNTVPKTMRSEEVEEHTKNDITLCMLMEAVTSNKIENCNNPELIPFCKFKDELTFKDNIILRGARIVLPTSL